MELLDGNIVSSLLRHIDFQTWGLFEGSKTKNVLDSDRVGAWNAIVSKFNTLMWHKAIINQINTFEEQ